MAYNHSVVVSTLSCHSVSLTCPVEATIYGFRPDLAANVVFAVVFIVCAIAQLVLAWRSRAWTISIFVFLGSLVEFIGYIGRIMLWQNPWSDSGFKIQISMLILGPVFLAAAIYTTLAAIVRSLTPTHSRLAYLSPLKPAVYTPLFMTADILCGVLQAVGGGIAAAAGKNTSELMLGNHVMLAGIAAQVFVSMAFVTLASTYAVRILHHRHELDEHGMYLLQSPRFRIFIASLTASFLFIIVRCTYRVGEMAHGWGNPIMRDQLGFIFCDGVMISLASCCLTVFHPRWVFPIMNRETEVDGVDYETEK